MARTTTPLTPDDLLNLLKEMDISQKTVEHEALHTVEDSQALRGDLPGGHCKNLFLKDKKGVLWLVVALETRPIKLNHLHKTIGAARLSFGNPDLLYDVLGVRPGSVTPFALINDQGRQVNVVLDKHLLDHDPVNFHPLTNEMTTALSSEDLLRFIDHCGHKPQILDFEGLSD